MHRLLFGRQNVALITLEHAQHEPLDKRARRLTHSSHEPIVVNQLVDELSGEQELTIVVFGWLRLLPTPRGRNCSESRA